MSAYVPMAARSLLFCDLETTSLDATHGEIVEIAAIRASHDLKSLEGKVHRLVKMKHPEAADRRALDVNKYDAALWEKHGVDMKVGLVELEGLIKKGGDTPIFVGMNPLFDLGFLEQACHKNGFPVFEFRYPLDVASMAWPLVKRGLIDRIGLDELSRRYAIEAPGKSHSAMNDTMRLIKVYCALMGIPSPL